MPYLRTTTTEEFRDSLEFAARTLADVAHNPSAWRWVIVSLHLALQGALVRALTHPAIASDGSLILEDHIIPRYRAWLDGGQVGDPPNRKLAIPAVLLRRVCDPAIMTGWALDLSESDRDSIEALRLRRNDIEHFHFDGWSLELGGLPPIVETVASVIERLLIEPNLDLSAEDARRIRAALTALKTARATVPGVALSPA